MHAPRDRRRLQALLRANSPRERRLHVAVRRRRRARIVVVEKLQRRRRRRLALAIITPLILLSGIGAGAVAGFFPIVSAVAGHPPQPRTFPADTLVYDRHGALIADLHQSGDTRIPVPLEQISQPLQEAIVAIEDKNFWNEGAIDPGRLAAAAWADLHHGSTQGASTIAMQLAKLLYLKDDRTLAYKVKEIAFANELLSKMSKSEILDEYLNDVPFAESATGIEAAAHVFFNVEASKLDLAQSAMLAGLPNAPGSDDPFLHPKAAHARQVQVLQAMVDVGEITVAQKEKAAQEKLTFADGWADNVDLAPAFVGRVYHEVSSTLHVDPNTAGLRVVSTLDLGLEQQAVQIVHQQVKAVNGLNVTDGALVSVDPRDGGVVAYVGSAGNDVPGGQIDMAWTPRQMGSTFKLFTYSTALAENRISMLTPVRDEPIAIKDGTSVWKPNDYDHKWHGLVPVEQALGNSLNIPAIRVELAAGIPAIVGVARKMGVTTLTADPSSYGPSMTLGTYPVPLWEMAQAATAFADQGRVHPAHFVMKAMDGWTGKVLYDAVDKPYQALDPGVAFIINAILRNDRNRWMEFGRGSDLTLPDHSVAAKTGTTDDFRDNLTVGWTPHLVTAAWVGNANDAPMHGTTGITGAAPIWHDFMEAALKGRGDDWQAPPPDVHPGPGGAWFLTGTDPRTGIAQLTGPIGGAGVQDISYKGGCRYWTYNGARYWSCGGSASGMPGDPGGGG